MLESTNLTTQNPWPGLRAFTETDREFFFGRERETSALVNLIQRESVVVLYGQSGLGKTSLIQAGIFPQLKKLNFLTFRVRFDLGDEAPPLADQIKAALVAELDASQITAPRPAAGETLWEYFHRRDVDFWGPKNRLFTPVIVLDQFEEVFTLGQTSAEASARVAQFSAELESLLEHRPSDAMRKYLDAHPDDAQRFDIDRAAVKFVVSLREDFLAYLDPWRDRMPSLMANRFRLERMSGAQALEVVERGGRDLVGPDVARAIVDFVSTSQRKHSTKMLEQRDVDPALLSVVCDELNRRRVELNQSCITTDLLSVEREEIIRKFYERAFEDIDIRVRVWVEDELLTANGYRNRAALEDALKLGLPSGAFDKLVNRRVLHREERSGVIWLELTHDLLTDPASQSRTARDQRVQTEAASAREAEIKRKLHRTRIVASGFAVILLGALVALVAALYLWREARSAEKLADESSKRANASSILANQKSEEAETKRKEADHERALAEHSADALRFQEMRVQEERLGSVRDEVYYLDSMLEKASPYDSWSSHYSKASLLIQQNNLDEAVKEANASIDLAPDSIYGRTERGYAQMLLSHPEKAVVDFEYVRDKINPKYSLNYLNLTIAYMQLRRDADANKSLDLAIYYSLHGQNTGGSEDVLPDEIKEATGRTILVGNSGIFRQALYFMKPFLAAFSGNKNFAADLKAAENQAKKDNIRPSEREDAALIALTWAWFAERMKTPNYGMSAGQGFLWNEAGYQDYAIRHYDAFLKTHSERKESKYNDLAAWVESNKSIPVPLDSLAIRARPAQLEVQSDVLSAEGKTTEAEAVISQAITLEPFNVRLYFKRMEIRYTGAGEARTEFQTATAKAKEDTDAIAKLSLSNPASPPASKLGQTQPPQTPAERAAAQKAEHEKLQADKDKQDKLAAEAKKKEHQLYQGMVNDTETVLKMRRDTPEAYFYRALASIHMETAKEPIIRDLEHALQLDPTFRNAIDWLAEQLKDTDPAAAAEWRIKFDRFYPGNPWNLRSLANLQITLKQFANAYNTVQKAIAIAPTTYALYKIRETAEKGLGFSDDQIRRDRIEGERAGMQVLLHGGTTEDLGYAKGWDDDLWTLLSDPGGKQVQEDVRCNPDVTTCVTIQQSVSHPPGEWALFPISSILPGGQDTRIVQIKRGRTSGVVRGSSGVVYSLYSDDGKRPAANIGSSEVLSVDAETAVVRVKMTHPEGNGMIRVQDELVLNIQSPPIKPRSILWSVLKDDITLVDRSSQKIADYSAFFSQESPELVKTIYQKLVDDIHETGRAAGDNMNGGKPVTKGRFAATPMSARDILVGTTREDLDIFFKYLLKYPATYFGHQWQMGAIYSTWVLGGMPEQ